MMDKAEFERLLDVYGFRCERFGQDLSTHARAQVVSTFAALASAPASEDGLTAKQAWWAGYRAGKGLPPDTPRQDAVKVDISSARLVTHWPNGTPRDERDTASDPEGKLIHDPTEPLLAASAPVAGEAQESIEQMAVNRYRPVPDGKFSYKVVAGDGSRSLYTGTKDSCLRVAAKLTEAFLDGAFVASYAAPQASEAAAILAEIADELDDPTLTSFGQVATGIRDLKERMGQASEAVAFDVEAAAKKLAECMDYPWVEMPEQGRAHMRKHAQAVVSAALSAQPGAQRTGGSDGDQ